MTATLVLIDIQNDYFPGGAMELVAPDEAGKSAALLLTAFRDNQLPVIHIQHISTRSGATFFLPGTKGAEIHNSVAPAQDELVVQKNYPNSFRDTPLRQYLKDCNASSLVIAGMMTHMCVDTTVRAAADLGFSGTLACDACATKDLTFNDAKVAAQDVQLAYLAGLNGMFATVTSTEEIINTL